MKVDYDEFIQVLIKDLDNWSGKPILGIHRAIHLISNMKKKHGGKRKGAGRPKLPQDQKKEPTKVMRIRLSKVDQVTKINNS